MKAKTTCPAVAVVVALAGLAPAQLPDHPPVNPKLPKATIPQPMEAQLDNGLTVLTVPVQRLPYVVVKWACRAGAQADPRMQAGMAYTVASGLLTGTQHRKPEEITETVNSHGLFFEANADYEALYVTVGTLPETLDAGMELLADVVRNPTFPNESWEGLVRSVRYQQMQDERNAQALTINALKRHVCGRHYYARSLYGTDITISKLTAVRAREFYAGLVGADRSVLLFCGMINPADALALAEKYFGDWKTAPEPLPPAMAPPKPLPKHIYLLDDTRARWSTVTIGRVGIARADEDYPVVRMLMAILAARVEEAAHGSLQAINRSNPAQAVQDDVAAGPTGGFIGITFAIPNRDAGKIIQVALDVCRKLGEEPMGLEYIEPASARLSGQLTLSLETITQLANEHMQAYLHGLGPDWHDRLLQQLAALTPEQLQDAARNYLNPDHLLVIVHANATTVKEYMVQLAPYDVIMAKPTPPKTLQPPERKQPRRPGAAETRPKPTEGSS